MRVDEALPAVDKAIDQAMLHSVDRLEIIHGVGTGRLMKAIREHVKGHPLLPLLHPEMPQPAGQELPWLKLKDSKAFEKSQSHERPLCSPLV